jgi:hypothetical protein
MKKNIFKIGTLVAFFGFPLITLAAGKTLRDIIAIVVDYLSIGIALIISLAVVTFTWNVYRYFFQADAENKKEAGMYVLYSTIGFFVILSLWGLVNILRNTFELDDSMPNLPFQSINTNRRSSVNSASNNPNAIPVQEASAPRDNRISVPEGTVPGYTDVPVDVSDSHPDNIFNNP